MTVEWYGPEVYEKIRQAAMRGVIRGTESIRNHAVESIMKGPKTGRIYLRGLNKSGKSYKVHQASAPGEPPATDTGKLASSITTEYDFANLIGRVNCSAEYGPYLEYGTVKMEPRPFMRPALAAKRVVIEADIGSEIKQAVLQARRAAGRT